MFDIVPNHSELKLSNKVDNQASAIVSGPKTGATLMQSGWLLGGLISMLKAIPEGQLSRLK